jgi:dihydrolipoamide dehydrogenase
MMTQPKRIVVIGAGPGGYTAAFLAADLGLEIILIDDAPEPGGVCLHRGCMPSKALLHLAKVLTEAEELKDWGVSFGEKKIDLEQLRSKKDGLVSMLTGGLSQLARQRKIDYVQGRAVLIDSHTVQVTANDGNMRDIQFDYGILATGSRPARLGNLELDHSRVLDSTRALDVRRVPESLLVVGGGYIGLELGSVYAALGATVTVVEMTSTLLPGIDNDLVRIFSRRFDRLVEAVHLNTVVNSLVPDDGGVTVGLSGPDVTASDLRFDEVLVAVGRVPNSNLEGLDNTLVTTDDRGFVKVDAQRRTGEPSLFAIGDLTGEPMLAHKAFHEARIAVETIAGENAAFEPTAIPAVVFTDPEIAWCGLTETEAKATGRTVAVSRFPWGASGRAVTLSRVDGMTKLILDEDSERILGVGIVGTGAGELIAEGVVAIEMGATARDLKECIHPHPTLSETMLESAEAFLGLSTHIYKPKKRN